MDRKLSCVYKITSPSGRIYIGSTKNFNVRIRYYKTVNCKQQPRLYSSLKKYGWDKHNIEIVELCDYHNLLERERYWGDFYKVLGSKGLNCILPKGNKERAIYDEKTRRNLSKAIKKKYKETGYRGNKKEIIDLLTGIYYDSRKELCELRKLNFNSIKEKLGLKGVVNNTQYQYADDSGNKAFQVLKVRKNSKAVINFKTGKIYRNILEASKESSCTLSTLHRMLNGKSPNKSAFKYLDKDLSFYLELNQKRKLISEEGRKNMSLAKKGEKNSFYGKTHSQEVREKIRLSQSGRKHSEEHRIKVSKNNAKNMCKIVLDIEMGIFYDSVKELCDLIGVKHSTMRARLNGTLKNNTKYIYI